MRLPKLLSNCIYKGKLVKRYKKKFFSAFIKTQKGKKVNSCVTGMSDCKVFEEANRSTRT